MTNPSDITTCTIVVRERMDQNGTTYLEVRTDPPDTVPRQIIGMLETAKVGAIAEMLGRIVELDEEVEEE